MLIKVEKGLRKVICHGVHQYVNSNNKYIKDYDKNKESPDLKYLYVNNLCGWAISQKLTVGVFEWVEETSQFNKDFTKSYNNDSNEGYFLKVDVQYPKELHKRDNDLPFLPERRKIGNVKKLVTIMHGKHMQN